MGRTAENLPVEPDYYVEAEDWYQIADACMGKWHGQLRPGDVTPGMLAEVNRTLVTNGELTINTGGSRAGADAIAAAMRQAGFRDVNVTPTGKTFSISGRK